MAIIIFFSIQAVSFEETTLHRKTGRITDATNFSYNTLFEYAEEFFVTRQVLRFNFHTFRR